jgi:hypothetical protein
MMNETRRRNLSKRLPAPAKGNGRIQRQVRRAPRALPSIPRWRRNLTRRPATPAKNNGRVQRLARRALLVLGTASTTEVMEWTCCRKDRRQNDDNRAARRALASIGAERIGRATSIGRPILWRLADASSATHE